MKRLLFFLTSSVLLLAGCAKERVAPSDLGEGLQTVTFTAAVEDGVATKAVADGDGAAASVNRCIMEVYYCDSLFTRMYAPVNSQKASFTLQMVSNRTYKVAFWADCVDSATTEAGLVLDKYYTTNATGGLQAIALKGTYAGNDDSRDAFYHVGNYEVKQGGSVFSDVKLKRPFAQMNVITTDWNVVSKVETLKPEKVNVTLKNPMVKFNAVTGVASADSGVPMLKYEAALYTSPNPVQPVSDTVKTLSMDYLFASETKEMIDIDWKATKANNADVAHTFAAVPYQRNYRTNIKGALLTTTGQWNVTIDSEWNTPDTDVSFVTVETPEEAKTALETKAADQQADGKEAVVTVTDFDGTRDDYALVIPDEITKANTPGVTFNANDVPAGKTLIVTDETIGGNCEYEGNVTLVTDAENVVVKTSKAHFELVGNAKVVYASTSDNTVVISKGYTVDSLIVEKGNVAVRGTVKSIRRGDNNPDDITYVDIYSSGKWENEENEQSKILIARHPSFVIGTEVYCSLQDAFNSTKDGDVIVLANDVNIATATINKAINVTLDLAGSTMTVENNNGDGLIISGGATLNLTNSIADKGTFVFKTNSSRNDGIYVYNTKEGETTTLNIQEPVKIVCETTSQNSSAHAEATAGKAAINLHEGAEFHVSSKSGSQVTAIMVGKYSEFNMDGGLFDMDVEFSSYSTNNDVVGVVLYGYPTATNAVNISGGEFNIGGKCAFAQGVQLSYYNGSNPGNVVNISGGEINLTENAGGKSYAFTMVSNGTYNITGGKVTATTPDDAELFGFQWNGSKRIISITGGEFFKKPADNYIPFGYAANEKDGVWVVDADSSLVYKEDGQSFGPGIVIGDIIWAPVNCGESVEEGGLFYQWGRKDGQTKGELAPEQISSSQVSNPADAQPNVFYKNDSNWYSGTGKLWNDGSEAVLEKAACDPCPDGWRMATYAELATLYVSFVKKAGYYSYVTDNGQTLSFPAVGCRQGCTGKTIDSPFSNYAFFWGGKFAEGKLWYWMIYDQQKTELIADDTAGKSDALPVRCVKFK